MEQNPVAVDELRRSGGATVENPPAATPVGAGRPREIAAGVPMPCYSVCPGGPAGGYPRFLWITLWESVGERRGVRGFPGFPRFAQKPCTCSNALKTLKEMLSKS